MTEKSPQQIKHPFPAVYDEHSRILVLGTMASPASRSQGFYYGHPHNRFWPVLAALFSEETPQSVQDRRSFALRHRIALWDVLASCTIEGASDASIRNPIYHDLGLVFNAAPITQVFTTGTKATDLYRKQCLSLYPLLPHIPLPSTSPANARMTLDALIEAYRPLRDALKD